MGREEVRDRLRIELAADAPLARGPEQPHFGARVAPEEAVDQRIAEIVDRPRDVGDLPQVRQSGAETTVNAENSAVDNNRERRLHEGTEGRLTDDGSLDSFDPLSQEPALGAERITKTSARAITFSRKTTATHSSENSPRSTESPRKRWRFPGGCPKVASTRARSVICLWTSLTTMQGDETPRTTDSERKSSPTCRSGVN
jgi:hypothetical protein